MYGAQYVRFHTITEVEKPLKTSLIPIHSPHPRLSDKETGTHKEKSISPGPSQRL